MQNMLRYGGQKSIKHGVINVFVGAARLKNAVTFGQMAALMTSIVGQPCRYEPLPPEVFLRSMSEAGADMAYMTYVYDHYKLYAEGTIHGADDTFDNFQDITGNRPTTWAGFIERHKADLAY